MRLGITSKRGGMLVYIKSSLSSKIMSNFKLSESIHYSGIYDYKVAFGDFNLKPTNPVKMNLMDKQNLVILIKNNTCFKGIDSCVDLI